jgi:DNA processing protein
MTACDQCLRRAWLLAALAPNLEIAWRARKPLRDILALDDEALMAALAGDGRERLAIRYANFSADHQRAECTAAGVTPVCAHDDRYPDRLSTGPGSPAVLHVAGNRDRLAALAGGDLEQGPPAVAIVGTRRASTEGLEIARALGRGLAAAGVTVVSGMALGIDSAAHAGALDAGGPTIAVLAGGPERPYPPSKATLHRRILADHVVVSEMPPGLTPFRWCFPARNRIIAALGRATIVVEAAERSGSLITADFATTFGREVAAVPGRAGSPRTRGSNGLLKDGASVILDAEDALDLALGLDRERGGVDPRRAGLDAALSALLDAVAAGRDTIDRLARSQAQARAARIGLAELELLGLVRRGAGGEYVAVPR